MGQTASPAPREILVFEVSGRRYGLRAADVVEVARAVEVASLPAAPAIVEGLIDARGRLVPVLDIRARFGLPPRPVVPSDHLVIVRAGSRTVAVRADRAVALVPVDEAAMASGREVRDIVPGSRYVAGVARLPDGLVLIHDLGTFLTQAEEAALDAAVRAASAAASAAPEVSP